MATKDARRTRIKSSIRKKVEGTSERPRMSVFRSNKEIYVQFIDDVAGKTLASTSSSDKGISAKGSKVELATEVGKKAAEVAIAAGIGQVVFDRNGYLYHGRVKALAEGAREGGLKF
ncbi:MAG: 50S ribosomal protein L18 [Flavobacteriales bacterium]|jgi:large subunit ribosomal protein L18|nr:50S ribosomal protein L18 [Flavobacteriales bacterium]|tara:strand:+ start:1263 stop:1613 length:351 start_codon:yes stop_codon:yes gene_type:complete